MIVHFAYDPDTGAIKEPVGYGRGFDPQSLQALGPVATFDVPASTNLKLCRVAGGALVTNEPTEP